MLLFITQHSGKTTAHPTRVTYKCGSNIPVKSPPGLKKKKSQKDISTQFKNNLHRCYSTVSLQSVTDYGMGFMGTSQGPRPIAGL